MTMQTLYDDQIYSYEMDSFGSKIWFMFETIVKSLIYAHLDQIQ